MEAHSSNRVEAEPGPIGRSVAARQFWNLIERWKVPDAIALDLIGFAGKIGKSGERPRFRFLPHHKHVTTYLAEIDAALTATGQDAEWLVKKNRSAPFGGKTPNAFMIGGGLDAMDEVLQVLHRAVWRSALKTET